MSKNTLLSELINYISANASGNVVIAAPSSGYALDVTGTGRFTGALTLGSTITNGTYTYTLPGATGTLALTSALSTYLPLSGGTLTGALSGTSATFSGAINLTGTANSFQVASIFRNANRVFFGGDTGGYYFQNSGNTATVLQIADSGAATFSSSVTTNGTVAINGSNALYLNNTDNTTTSAILNGGASGVGVMQFYQGGSERMRITGGNVGIGTTSPASKLHIEGTGTGAWITINRTDTGTNIVDYTQSGTRLGYIGYIGSEMWLNNATASDISIRTSGTEKNANYFRW